MLRIARRLPRHAPWPMAHEHRAAFHSLKLGTPLVDQLARLGISQPTPAQQQAIPRILQGEDVVIAAETGGGKTLAYLLPVLHKLSQLPPDHSSHLPVALVLTASADLVRQLATVVHDVAPTLAATALALPSANASKPLGPLVIATPRALLRASSPRDFAFTEVVVVDEADMLLGGGFEKDTKQLLATIRNQPLLRRELNDGERRSFVRDDNEEEDDDNIDDRDSIRPEDISPERTQVVFSAATIPDYGKRSVRSFIAHKFPDAAFTTTPDFQRTLPRLTVEWRDLQAFMASHRDTQAIDDVQRARHELLYEILSTTDAAKGNTLVFANSIASANALAEFLRVDKQLPDCEVFHKEIDRAQRQRVLRTLDDETAGATVVCTDIAARGLDTTKVGHVVQFEFATDVVSYLHRIGRTARAGSTGRVTNIISAENELVLAKIREAGAASLSGAFSRKRSLRKKAKKTRRQQDSESSA